MENNLFRESTFSENKIKIKSPMELTCERHSVIPQSDQTVAANTSNEIIQPVVFQV